MDDIVKGRRIEKLGVHSHLSQKQILLFPVEKGENQTQIQ